MKKFAYFLFLLLISFCSIAQNKKLDSLWGVYNDQTQPLKNRLKAIHTIAWQTKNNNPDSSIILVDQELALIYSLHSEEKRELTASAFNTKGVCYMNKGDYAKALEYFSKTAKIYIELKSKINLANCYSNMGIVYENEANFPKALECYLKSLKIFEETNNIKGKANQYNNIGVLYVNLKNYPKALEYYQKSLEIYKEFNDKISIAELFCNIGTVYNYQENYSKALEYYNKSIIIEEEMGDDNGIGITYCDIGVAYNGQKNYAKALEYFFRALKIHRVVADKHNMAICYVDLCKIYNTLQNYKASVLYCDTALQISSETGDINQQMLVLENLADVFSKINKHKQAYEIHKKFKHLADSIFNIENSKQLGDMKTNFEVEKKEFELKAKADAQEAINKEEKTRQKFITYSVAGVLILVVVFAGFMVNRFRVTNKQKKIIEIKERETQHQKHIIEEKHLEITDSINYAERIQRAMLASKQLLNENSILLSKNNLKEGDGYFVFFKPKDVVSGDFYWASKINSNQFCLVTADSTGHGVPGAIMSMLNMNSLKEAVTKGLTEADEILNYTRNIIINTLANDGSAEGGKDGMDCSLLIFDYKTMNLNWCAANNPVWVVRNAGQSNIELIELKPQKMPVGKHDRQNEPFIKQIIQLQHGDLIYTMTDGFPDQFGGAKGKKFMSKNLKELLSSNANLPMNEQKALLNQTFKNWVGDLEQVDDVTIIGIKV